MFVVAIDALALAMLAAGIALAAWRPHSPGTHVTDPRAYARRIAGTMLAAFGLALGALVTAFHYASG